jgi:hypothetical protein
VLLVNYAIFIYPLGACIIIGGLALLIMINITYNPFKNKTVGFGQRPRPLHNRYTRTGTFVRWGMAVTHSRYNFKPFLPKRFRNGRFASETTVRRFQKLNCHLDPEVIKKIRWGF